VNTFDSRASLCSSTSIMSVTSLEGSLVGSANVRLIG
jgi:hypothetical protein